MEGHYDVIVIGTGAGGGTLARHLAPSGKRILLLERGDWLPREPANWSTVDVFVDGRYISPDSWYDPKAKSFFQPQVHYFVGGATKLYGAALYRMRAEDFGELHHHDGLSPAWPISYQDMEPYYSAAETMYQGHGGHPGGGRAGRRNRAVSGRHRGRLLRRGQLRQAAAGLRQRQAPERAGQRLRSGGPQLHVPRQPGRARLVQGPEPDRVPEDPRRQRLLLPTH